jgi:hypothetical protein
VFQIFYRFGVRNSLLVAPMPTASTAQILGNCESFEPYTSNIYTRRVLSGEFQVWANIKIGMSSTATVSSSTCNFCVLIVLLQTVVQYIIFVRKVSEFIKFTALLLAIPWLYCEIAKYCIEDVI